MQVNSSTQIGTEAQGIGADSQGFAVGQYFDSRSGQPEPEAPPAKSSPSPRRKASRVRPTK